MSTELAHEFDNEIRKQYQIPLVQVNATTTTNARTIQNNRKKIATLCIGYCFSSALLAIVNKWALIEFPYPSILTAFQYSSSAIAVTILGKFGVVERVRLDWKKARQFTPAVVLFYVSIFTNSKLLQHANVDTFIVFRSCCPLLVLPLEYLFLRKKNNTTTTNNHNHNNHNHNSENGSISSHSSGNISNGGGGGGFQDVSDLGGHHQQQQQEMQMMRVSIKQLFSLISIFLGAVGFALVDKRFQLHSYFWGISYVISMTIDMVLIKKIVTNVDLSTWGLVYYNNVLAMFLFPIAYFISGDYALYPEMMQSLKNDNHSIELAIITSCLMGLSISYFGLGARRAVGATTFTVLGVVNKIGTVIINTLIWNHHASPLGLMFLMICVSGGVVYQQEASKTKKTRREEQRNARNILAVASRNNSTAHANIGDTSPGGTRR